MNYIKKIFQEIVSSKQPQNLDYTSLDIQITSVASDDYHIPSLSVNKADTQMMVVDWGDGTSPSTSIVAGSQDISHTYSATGDYTIKIYTNGSWAIDGYVLGTDSKNRSMKVDNVFLSSSVTSIEHYAFFDCSSLASITIPDNVTSIHENAFYRCSSLASITIPSSVTSIGYAAFYNCSSLASITIGNGVMTIAGQVFYRCSSLVSIVIPSSVTSIGEEAFSGCSKLASITVTSGNAKYDSRDNCNAIIETSTNQLIAGCKNTVIPSSVTSIEHYAFFDCSSLASITIPSSVTSIGYAAFYNCSSLASITIPSSVTSIGDSAFNGCSKLTSMTFMHTTTNTITLPTAGSSGGMLYSPIARAMTIDYYGNTTVRDYAYATDNITATLVLKS